MLPDLPRFEPRAMLRTLVDHDVAFVLIGGLAAVIHGSPTYTNDADICPSRDRENLSRLAASLRAMHAKIRTDAEPEGLPFSIDAEFLARMKMVNMQTDFGWFDITFEPGGFPGGYQQLEPNAASMAIEDFSVRVASLHDIIASKEAANRPKDQAALPYLYALEDELAAIEREQRDRR